MTEADRITGMLEAVEYMPIRRVAPWARRCLVQLAPDVLVDPPRRQCIRSRWRIIFGRLDIHAAKVVTDA